MLKKILILSCIVGSIYTADTMSRQLPHTPNLLGLSTEEQRATPEVTPAHAAAQQAATRPLVVTDAAGYEPLELVQRPENALQTRNAIGLRWIRISLGANQSTNFENLAHLLTFNHNRLSEFFPEVSHEICFNGSIEEFTSKLSELHNQRFPDRVEIVTNYPSPQNVAVTLSIDAFSPRNAEEYLSNLIQQNTSKAQQFALMYRYNFTCYSAEAIPELLHILENNGLTPRDCKIYLDLNPQHAAVPEVN